jgi:hypothetical protein
LALREIFAHFGFDFDRSKLEAANAGVNAVKNNARAAGGPQGIGALVTGLKGFLAFAAGNQLVQIARDITEQAAALKDTSEQTGLATSDLQAYGLAAEMAGGSATDFAMAVKKLSKELATGTDETGGQSKIFSRLKIEARDASGNVRNFGDVLPEIAQKISELGSSAEQTALASEIFGRSGQRLLPILRQGAAGVAQLKGQLDELGGGFSEEAINRADEYDDAVIKLSYSFRSLKSLLVVQLAPILSTVVTTIVKGVAWVARFNKGTTAATHAVGALAAILSGKLMLALAPFLLPGLKFLAIFLAVDDVIAFLRGKDSVIGTILKGWFGQDTVDDIRSFFNSIGTIAEGMFAGIAGLWRMLTATSDAEMDKARAAFFRSTEAMVAAIDNWFLMCGIAFGNVVVSFDDMVLSIQGKWNSMIESLMASLGPLAGAISGLQIDTGDAEARKANHAEAVRKMRLDIESNKDRVANGGNAINWQEGGAIRPMGPLKAPVVTTNYVEVNPQVSVQLPQGVSGTQARELARQAVVGSYKGASLKPALQALENRGGS